MSAAPESGNEQYEFDPVFLNSRREAKIIFGVWFLCLIWAVPVSYLLGYHQTVTPDNVETIVGIPTWAFWGLFLPWLAADVITTAFCFWYLKEDELGHADDEGPRDAESHVAGSSNAVASQEDAQ